MSNDCEFYLQIRGKEADVMVATAHLIAHCFDIPGRIKEQLRLAGAEARDGFMAAYLYGDCAWSCEPLVSEGLPDVSRRYDVTMSLRSLELGNGFAEFASISSDGARFECDTAEEYNLEWWEDEEDECLRQAVAANRNAHTNMSDEEVRERLKGGETVLISQTWPDGYMDIDCFVSLEDLLIDGPGE